MSPMRQAMHQHKGCPVVWHAIGYVPDSHRLDLCHLDDGGGRGRGARRYAGGGAITLVFYGLLPAALIGYILGTPARKRARRARDEAASREDALTAGSANEPDAGGHAAAGAETRGIAPVGEEAGRIGDRAPPL